MHHSKERLPDGHSALGLVAVPVRHWLIEDQLIHGPFESLADHACVVVDEAVVGSQNGRDRRQAFGNFRQQAMARSKE